MWSPIAEKSKLLRAVWANNVDQWGHIDYGFFFIFYSLGVFAISSPNYFLRKKSSFQKNISAF